MYLYTNFIYIIFFSIMISYLYFLIFLFFLFRCKFVLSIHKLFFAERNRTSNVWKHNFFFFHGSVKKLTKWVRIVYHVIGNSIWIPKWVLHARELWAQIFQHITNFYVKECSKSINVVHTVTSSIGNNWDTTYRRNT